MKYIILCMFLLGFYPYANATDRKVCFKEDCVSVMMANTSKEMVKGLSGHPGLKENEGMLFAFEKEGTYIFWMKDMNFGLDILWLDRNGKIVYILENLPPCTSKACPKYASKLSAQYVLEVPAGYVKAHALKTGDLALLP